MAIRIHRKYFSGLSRIFDSGPKGLAALLMDLQGQIGARNGGEATVKAEDITDASAIGQSVLKAADQDAAREVIGAISKGAVSAVEEIDLSKPSSLKALKAKVNELIAALKA